MSSFAWLNAVVNDSTSLPAIVTRTVSKSFVCTIRKDLQSRQTTCLPTTRLTQLPSSWPNRLPPVRARHRPCLAVSCLFLFIMMISYALVPTLRVVTHGWDAPRPGRSKAIAPHSLSSLRTRRRASRPCVPTRSVGTRGKAFATAVKETLYELTSRPVDCTSSAT